MYILFSIIFIIICSILIFSIIFYPNENNILELYTNYNNNKSITTSNLIKNTFDKIIITLIILFYLISIILNSINNIKINNIKNKINNIKILNI